MREAPLADGRFVSTAEIVGFLTDERLLAMAEEVKKARAEYAVKPTYKAFSRWSQVQDRLAKCFCRVSVTA